MKDKKALGVHIFFRLSFFTLRPGVMPLPPA